MNLIVADDCFHLGLRAGAIVFRNVRVTALSPAQRAEMADAVAAVQARFSSPSAIRADPYVGSFRAILQQVGVNPKKDQPSVEKLMTFAYKHGNLPAINNLVDAYNLVSVRSSCSLGAHDLDRISLPVTLRLLDGSESFTPLGTDRPVPVTAGEYGYVDASNRLLCRLDVLQADFSKVTEATVNALLIVEGTIAHSAQDLRKAFADVMELVTRYCGGTGEIITIPQ
jgi:DNA/RNA-binding domain of Phe-tRNA-synthetase-like protein